MFWEIVTNNSTALGWQLGRKQSMEETNLSQKRGFNHLRDKKNLEANLRQSRCTENKSYTQQREKLSTLFYNVVNVMVYSWIPWNSSFRCIDCTGQFTPKMEANTEPRLLSSLVWIDSGVVVSQHRLESFFHEIKCNRMTSFMEFMVYHAIQNAVMTFVTNLPWHVPSSVV